MPLKTIIRRRDAEQIIDDTRKALASLANDDFATALLKLAEVADTLGAAGVPALEICNGEAHANAYIDHCMECAPRWGYRGERVEVR